jgi:hypothetical protein
MCGNANDIMMRPLAKSKIFSSMIFKVIAIFAILLDITSCSGAPKQTLLGQDGMIGLSRVLICSSTTMLDLKYSSQSTKLSTPGFLFGWALLEYRIRELIDYLDSHDVKSRLVLDAVEKSFSNTFAELLERHNVFSEIDQIRNSKTEDCESTNYDAIIQLGIREISIEVTTGNYINMNVIVNGKARNVKSSIIFWERSEKVRERRIKSAESRTENLSTILEPLLIKAANNLAYDFIYLK